MVSKLTRDLIKKINFLRYRFRYLYNYMIIGTFAVLLEILIVKYTPFININFLLKVGIGFLAGVSLSFILNARLNFKVPKSRNRKTFLMFLTISTIAFFINLVLMALLKEQTFLTYGPLRFASAVIIFSMTYTLHRRITFDFVKKVGIAIYLNEGEDLSDIYSKVRYYADFVHLDLVDKSFNPDAERIDISLIKDIDRTWGLEKMLHLMSKNPSIWIKKLRKSIDIFLFHLNIDEPVEEIIKLCREYSLQTGIVLSSDSEINPLLKYLPHIDFVQIMGIDQLGISGQDFNPKSLEIVNELNKLKRKYNFKIIFDGGVKPTNIHRINAKYIVSSSGLLLSEDPIKSFMDLKTSSRYYQVGAELRTDILREIKEAVNSLNFVVSGNIVGSFSEEQGIKGISDIDIVLITDSLDKEKYFIILEKFEKLRKKIQSKYGYCTLINSSFGPLKFDINSIVFHLMIYDKNSHKEHCLKSPFTCLDWQRTKIFYKKHMRRIYNVQGLQPNYFFNSRRNISEYLLEIKENRISYREYNFKGNKVIEEKKFKEMDTKHKIEFSYHITKFLISNFLKLYYKKNKIHPFNEMLKRYFAIFPKNKKIHKPFLKNIRFLKKNKKFIHYPNLISSLEFFIRDFEKQFKNYFYDKSSEVYFIRHSKTNLNKENVFLGQKHNPKIIPPNKKTITNLKEQLNNLDLIFSSPLRRCKETLNLITNKEIKFDNRIKEIDYGEIDGKDLDYLTKNYPYIIQGWEIGEDPRFPRGENTFDVFKRAREFLIDLKKYNAKKILVCTHNVVLRNIIGSYFKIPLKNWFKIDIPYNQPIKFIISRNKRFYIELTDNQTKELFKNL